LRKEKSMIIHSSNFGFSEKLADIDNYEVQEGDVIIHKEIQEGERFPAIKYHVVSGKKKGFYYVRKFTTK